MSFFDDDVLVNDYSDALKHMYTTPFKVKIPMDENRFGDVDTYLRIPYKNEVDRSTTVLNRPPSILEILIATLMRFCESVGDNFNGEELPDWETIFWDALCNMGIVPNFDNENILYNEFNGVNLYNDLDDILHRFNERTYALDGSGGPFPLGNEANFTAQKFAQNQRDLDLYHLVNIYVGEKVNFYA